MYTCCCLLSIRADTRRTTTAIPIHCHSCSCRNQGKQFADPILGNSVRLYVQKRDEASTKPIRSPTERCVMRVLRVRRRLPEPDTDGLTDCTDDEAGGQCVTTICWSRDRRNCFALAPHQQRTDCMHWPYSSPCTGGKPRDLSEPRDVGRPRLLSVADITDLLLYKHINNAETWTLKEKNTIIRKLRVDSDDDDDNVLILMDLYFRRRRPIEHGEWTRMRIRCLTCNQKIDRKSD